MFEVTSTLDSTPYLSGRQSATETREQGEGGALRRAQKHNAQSHSRAGTSDAEGSSLLTEDLPTTTLVPAGNC